MGQTVYFPGYMYTTPDQSWARSAYSCDEGILLELHFKPGERLSISCNEVLTPRSKLAKCLGTEELRDENGKFTKIILEVLRSDEIFQKV